MEQIGNIKEEGQVKVGVDVGGICKDTVNDRVTDTPQEEKYNFISLKPDVFEWPTVNNLNQ